LRRQDRFPAAFQNQLSKSRLYAAALDDIPWQNAAGALGHRVCGSGPFVLTLGKPIV
jgi:hypothetical protein